MRPRPRTLVIVLRALVAVALVLALVPTASAHACYLLVNNTTSACPREGPDGAMLAEGLTASFLVPVLLGGLLAAPLLVGPMRALAEARAPGAGARVEAAAAAYARDFLPLVLRAGLGVALLASGLGGEFLSPLAKHGLGVAAAVVGALLVLGLATRWAALAAAGYYLGALPTSLHLLGNVEALVVALALAFWLPPGRPSVDDWLREARGAPAPTSARAFEPRVALALRLGLAAALAYGALAEKLLDPHVMARVADAHGLSGFLGLPAASWALITGVGELAFALALLVGFETRLTGLALAATVVAMTVGFSENLALHATLLAGALALALTGPGGYCLRVTTRFVREEAAA